MNTVDQTFHCIDDRVPTFDVTDEALESAAGTKVLVSYTYAGCTAVTYCPEY